MLYLLRADVSVLADHLALELDAGRLHTPAFVASLPIVGPDLSAWFNAMLDEPLRWKTELKALVGKLDTELWTLLGGVGKNIVKLGLSLFTLFFAYLHGLSLLEQARTVLKSLLRERTDGYVNAVATYRLSWPCLAC